MTEVLKAAEQDRNLTSGNVKREQISFDAIRYIAVAVCLSPLLFFLFCWVSGERLPKATPVVRNYKLSISGNPPTFQFDDGNGLIVRQFEDIDIRELDSNCDYEDSAWTIQNMNPEYKIKRLTYGRLPKNWTQDGSPKQFITGKLYGFNNEYCFKRRSDGSYQIFESPFKSYGWQFDPVQSN
ncbi:MAG: hypothetical protein KC777_11030 [Cyanobacteria bacterium HKST-UBA02]|nr:hypothetical protein [Cyanobacteria bacterium HKST-UBA02]